MTDRIYSKVDVNGITYWFKNDELHRDDDKPAFISDSGNREIWYRNGKRHREGKPADIGPDHEIWYHRNLKHREDGPAMTWKGSNDEMIEEWWIYGKRAYSYQQFQDLTKHSDQYIMYLKLKWGEIQCPK